MLRKLEPVFTKFLDIIYPPCCIACGIQINENGSLCHKCWGEINFISDPQCGICGFPFDFNAAEGTLCGNCIDNQPKFSKARAVFLYNDTSRPIITSFKYGDRLEGIASFAKWMSRVGNEMIAEADYLVPVPLHLFKLIFRKYNQASLLANELAKIHHKKVLHEALLRNKFTKTQSGLNRKKRLQNIKGAFQVNKKYVKLLAGKKILLIDDVITTGATTHECTNALLKARVAKVEVLTLAKTIY